MPVVKLPADTPNQWPGLLYDVMQTPVGAETGALFDAMEADASQLKKRGRPGGAMRNHLKLSLRQLRSRKILRGPVAGHVLMLTLARAEAGEKRKGVKATLSAVQAALEERWGTHKGAGLTELKASWRDFRPTAHLWAAQILFPRSLGELIYNPPVFLTWIAMAEDLRRRGEAFRPLTGKTPILDPSTTWRMPDELVLPPVRVNLRSFDAIISELKSKG